MKKSGYIKSVLIAIASIVLIISIENSLTAREMRGEMRGRRIEHPNMAPRYEPRTEGSYYNHGAAARSYEAGEVNGAAVGGAAGAGGAYVEPSPYPYQTIPQQPAVDVNVQSQQH